MPESQHLSGAHLEGEGCGEGGGARAAPGHPCMEARRKKKKDAHHTQLRCGPCTVYMVC